MTDSLVQDQHSFCNETARRIECAAQALGRAWPGFLPLMELCSRFRQQCEELAASRGFDMQTISFVGPKKSGKSTLIRLLLRDDTVRQQIKAGSPLRDSTEKLVWVGPTQPVGIDPTIEDYVPCSEAGMPSLGIRCTLADVPGDNEGDPARAGAAQRALDLSLVKVLVVEFRDRRNEGVFQLLRRAGRSVVLPVITKIKPSDERAELDGYRDSLQSVAPEATILEPLQSEEFDHVDTPADYVLQFAAELRNRLVSAILGRQIAPLAADLLEGERIRFIAESRKVAAENLRASATAAPHFQKACTTALINAASGSLGNEKQLRAEIRWTFRMTLLDRTPGSVLPVASNIDRCGINGRRRGPTPACSHGNYPVACRYHPSRDACRARWRWNS